MDRKIILIAILALAAILRFWGLERGDAMNDEVFYAFRAVGLLDFDAAEFQTTPLEWFDPRHPAIGGTAAQNLGGQAAIPFWTKLSFHDHPPLVFWVQHVFLKVFGENTLAFRLPSAILGVVSVYLLYLIGAHLYSYRVGLLASALMAVTLNHVYISRTGMQESFVIFFMLLAFYFFLKALRKDIYFIWLGVILGLALLTKFTSMILIPIFSVYLLIFRRDYFLRAKLWIGAALALIIFSPVIIYNMEMYRAVGHFDFQFSALFGQHPDVWKEQPGKEIGAFVDRIRAFVPRLISTHSWLFLTALALALTALLTALVKNFRKTLRPHAFLLISAGAMAIFLILLIGPSFRFLTMLTPYFVLAVAVFFLYLADRIFLFFGRRKAALIIYALLAIFLSLEIAYSYNNQIAYYPKGNERWFASKIRFENYNWGYNALDKYLDEEFAGQMPALTFDPAYKFLDDIRERALGKAREEKLKPMPFLIVYGGNFDDGALLWVILRRSVYHAWPVISLEDFTRFREKEGADYFTRLGFRNLYFIFTANTVFLPETTTLLKNVEPTTIMNQRGDKAFFVYEKVN